MVKKNMATKKITKKDVKKQKQNPIVKDLLKIFDKYLLSVCELEFSSEKTDIKDLKVPKVEKELLAIVNDKLDEKSKKLISNYKGKVKILPLSGLWQSCYDQKYDLIRSISNPKTNKLLYDRNFVKSLMASEILRTLVLQKLNKYIITMILVGSVSRGQQHELSDVDISFVVDDTDVKRMSKSEVRGRLLRIIHEKAAQTGFEFNIQVYLLTDFWQSLRDTHPVIFSMVRDGIPLQDKGMFIPWQTLLKTGKMKPSPESVEQFFRTGRLLIDDVKKSVKELVIERLFLAMFNPAQAACMMVGIPPTHHGDTPKVFKKYFVDELKLVEPKFVDYLTQILKYRKDVEYGVKKTISIKEFVEQLNHAEEFQTRMKKLFEDIKNKEIKTTLDKTEKKIVLALQETLKSLGVKFTKKDLLEKAKINLLDSGLMTSYDFSFIKTRIVKAKRDFKKNLLTTVEANMFEKEGNNFIRTLKNIKESYDLRTTEKYRVHFTYGNKNGELWILGNEVYIIKNLKQPETDVIKAQLKEDGSFKDTKISNIEELTKARNNYYANKILISVKPQTLDSVRDLISGDIEFVF